MPFVRHMTICVSSNGMMLAETNLDGMCWPGVLCYPTGCDRSASPHPNGSHKIAGPVQPVSLSAMHVSWGGIRLEPVFLQTGEAAGLATALGTDDEVAVIRLAHG